MQAPRYIPKTSTSDWNPAYSLTSILLQLYVVMIADPKVRHYFWGNLGPIRHTPPATKDGKPTPQATAHAFSVLGSCSCGHHMLPDNLTADAHEALVCCASSAGIDPTPFLPARRPPTSNTSAAAPAAQQAEHPAATDDQLACLMDNLHEPLQRHIVTFLDPRSLLFILNSKGRFAQLAADTLQRADQVCYVTRRSPHRTASCAPTGAHAPPVPEMTLGFGVIGEWHKRSGTLKALSTRGEYLSAEAFDAGTRTSARGLPFDAFLPLYLNPRHGARALALLPACVANILQHPDEDQQVQQRPHWRSSSDDPQLPPRGLLRVLGTLLNTLVVELLQNRRVSEAKLQVLCHLHHLLLAVALEPGSQLLDVALRNVRQFVASPAARCKERTPDLGALLVQLLLVPKEAVPWSELAPPLLRELLARQVRWAARTWAATGNLQPGPEFTYCRPHGERTVAADRWRLQGHFKAAEISLHTMMLQAWFGNALARPATLAGRHQELSAIKAAYDACSGRPPERLLRSFEVRARAVRACKQWTEFLRGMRLGFRADLHPKRLMAAMLRQAVVDSFAAGYHDRPVLLSSEAAEVFVDWERVRPVAVLDDDWARP